LYSGLLIRFQELLAATSDFSRLLKLGEGGFGSVYKGVIRLLGGPAGGMVAAIKKLNPKGHQVPICVFLAPRVALSWFIMNSSALNLRL